MKRLMRLTALLLALSLCILPVHAAEPEDGTVYFTEWSEGLDEIMANYMAEHNLSEKNFSMGYLYTGTGEYWYFNQDKVMTAGSIYKVPLNMRITEMVADGERSWDDYICGLPLAEAQRMSVTYSKNDISYALQSYCAGISDFYYPAYRTELLKYSTWTEAQIPEDYYTTNTFTADFMLNILSILYQGSDFYSNVIGYMLDAHPGEFFRLYEGEYEIAHKYGSYEGALNDIGIVYTPEPFLLVVMTQNVGGAEKILGELCRLMTEYTVQLSAKYEAERQACINEAETLARSLAAAEAAEAEAAYSAIQQTALTELAEAYVAELADALALSILHLSLS